MHYCRNLAFLINTLCIAAQIPAQVPGNLHGIVTLGGSAARGSTVSVYREDSDKKSYSANVVTTTLTDGSYSLTLSPGTYILIVTVDGTTAYQGEVVVPAGASLEKSISLKIDGPPSPAAPTTNCVVTLRDKELHERHYVELTEANLPGLFVYAGDIHDVTSRPNELDIITYEPSNSRLKQIQSVTKSRTLSIGELMASASATQKGLYRGSGADFNFSLNGSNYRLITTGVRHRVGFTTQSVVFSICHVQ